MSTGTVREKIVGRPKKNPNLEGPPTSPVRLNSLTVRKARVLANVMDMPLTDFLDEFIRPGVDRQYEFWKQLLIDKIRVQDETQPDWRERLVTFLGGYQARGLDYRESLEKRAKSPELTEEQRAEVKKLLEDVIEVHNLYLEESMLKSIEEGKEYTDADELLAQDLERQLYGKGKP